MQQQIETVFQQMGARAKLTFGTPPERFVKQRRRLSFERREPFRIDVQRDNYGEYYDLRQGRDVRIEIPDCVPSDRHLVLLVHRGDWGQTQTYLCGRDERSWFVAAIPEAANARDVQAAKDARKPPEVWDAMRTFGVPMDRRDRRRTAAFARQGEWFFIPRPGMNVADRHVLHNEPMRRGAGKAHMCQFLHRVDGETVWVNDEHPNGLTWAEYHVLSIAERRQPWQQMVRDARVFVRGAIRHPDHNTIWLTIWHHVVMNTETQSRAMEHMAFLD
jgi:hypothetical protein